MQVKASKLIFSTARSNILNLSVQNLQMPHYLFAFSSLLLATVSIFFSYRESRKNNYRLSALLLVIAAIVLRIYVASDQYLHEWDERYHALVAKNLMENFFLPKLYKVALLPYDVSDWSSGFIWLHKQPLPLWCMALSMKLFGVNELALRLPSVIISGAAVYLTYFIGKKLFSQQIGLMAAFFHAINGLVIELTGGRVATDHVDIFFLFFVELAVVFSIMPTGKRKIVFNILAGICIGLSVLCKWLPALVVLVIWLVFNFDRKNISATIMGWIVVAIAACAIFVPWQIYAQARFPVEYRTEMLHNLRHITEVLDGREGGPFYFFGKLFITVNEFFWLAFVWFCVNIYRKDRARNRVALVLWAALPFIFFSLTKTKMQAYLLFVYPALFIILADFCIYLTNQGQNPRMNLFKKLVLITVIGLSVRYTIERFKPLQDQSRDIKWASEFRKMNSNSDKKVYLNINHRIEGMFYTNAIMYGYIPTGPEIEELKKKGYEVIINQNPDL